MIRVKTIVNGADIDIDVEERLTLVDLLRDHLGLLGTKVACDRGVCGACTVLMDGLVVAACNTFAFEAGGHSVRTIETEDRFSRLQRAFVEAGALQCGYCTSGMILLAAAFLARNPRPTPEQVRVAMSASICRCTGYQQIVEAVLLASDQVQSPILPSADQFSK